MKKADPMFLVERLFNRATEIFCSLGYSLYINGIVGYVNLA